MARVAAEQGLDAAGVRRPDRRRLARAAAQARRLERLLHPHERRGPQGASSRTSCSASTTTATSTRTSTRASTASAARRSRPRRSSSTASAPSTAPSPSGSRRRTSSSGSPPTRTGCSSSTTSARTSSCPTSATTRRGASSPAGCRTSRISRAGQPWGVPMPWDPDQVAYVWADALVNYLSALTYARPGEDLASEFWPAVRHLLGEGHPPLPLRLLAGDAARRPDTRCRNSCSCTATSCSTTARSRSRSATSIDPLDLIDVYGADAVRFWCARAVSFGQDGAASIDGVHERYERELGNDLGNLLSRTTAMIARYRGGHLRRVAVRLVADQGGARSARRGGRRAARRLRPDRGARADLGGRARAQPVRRDARRRGSSRRTRRSADELDADALRPRRRAPRRRGRPRRVHPGRRRRGSSRRSDSRSTSRWERVAYGLTGDARRDRAAPSRSSPGSTRPSAAA